jgi:hypothetical protein
MILGFMGDLGSGKTLGAVIFAYNIYFLSNKKLSIWANFTIKGANKIKSLSQLKRLNNSILVLDELHILIDARMWKFNKELMDYFLQLRKYNNFLIFTTQHIKQVDVRLRNVTQYIFYCQRFSKYFRYTLLDILYKDVIKTLYLPKEVAKVFYDKYNTFEKVYKMPKKLNKYIKDIHNNISDFTEDLIFEN